MRRAHRLRLLAAVAAMLTIAGCGKPPQSTSHPDWVIHSKIVFLSQDLATARTPLPLTQFRMQFPYISGDLYGAPTTGDFIQPVISQDYRLEIDLNTTQATLLVSLEPTDFSLPDLRIEPREARIARLTPMALQADGIEQIGRTDWVDSTARERLMLLYVDRAAHISGEILSKGKPLSYDMRMSAPGYYWIARQSSTEGDVYRVIARPAQVAVAITPTD